MGSDIHGLLPCRRGVCEYVLPAKQSEEMCRKPLDQINWTWLITKSRPFRYQVLDVSKHMVPAQHERLESLGQVAARVQEISNGPLLLCELGQHPVDGI